VKVTANSFGTLVRPRIMSYARILPRLDAVSEQDKWNLNSLVDAPHYGEKEINLYKTPYEDLFTELVIGDTSKDLSNCYVGVITSFITSINYKHYILVDKSNVNEIMEKLRKRYGRRESIPVHHVGVKFYKGLQRNPNGELIAINPWRVTKENHTWFYRPWDLIPMETIIRYENLVPGDLVLFKRSQGIVVKAKNINKKKFYKTNSWSSRSVTVLLGNGKTFLRFLPNKNFKGRKSSDPI
jgi:hypothetical protein